MHNLREHADHVLENNPEVFAHLVQKLGASPDLGFYDVYSLDPEMLSLIPRPVYALLFICPGPVYHAARDEEDAQMKPYEGTGEDDSVVWMKQTIHESCGLMGLLHAVFNSEAQAHIKPGSDLEKLLKEARPLGPKPRADLIYNSQALEDAHAAAAQLGDTSAPPLGEDASGHYIAFAKGAGGRLWELNGGMKGPVLRGQLAEDEDALSEKALQLGVRSFLEKAGDHKTDSFSIVALAPKKPE